MTHHHYMRWDRLEARMAWGWRCEARLCDHVVMVMTDEQIYRSRN